MFVVRFLQKFEHFNNKTKRRIKKTHKNQKDVSV